MPGKKTSCSRFSFETFRDISKAKPYPDGVLNLDVFLSPGRLVSEAHTCEDADFGIRETLCCFGEDPDQLCQGVFGKAESECLLQQLKCVDVVDTREVGFGFGLETNSGRKPSAVLLDLRGERPVRLARLDATLFGRVFNAFDSKFWNGFVFGTSGSPYYSRYPAKDLVTLANPTRFYPPRRIEIGVTLRGSEP